jgi:1,4-alpha-glucan branching enzyme
VPVTEFGEHDQWLLNEGNHLALDRVLGGHLEADGARFRVWAPNASAVAIVGEPSDWQQGVPLTPSNSGVWEGFVAGATRGQRYKYRITDAGGGIQEKADPFAFATEHPPATASVLWDLEYEWGDEAWSSARADRAPHVEPMSIYEVHLGSWRRPASYRGIAPALADHVERLGFTHVELMPVMEHPFYGSWGYQTTGFFAPTARYGTPQDLMYLIDYLHQRGIGVILDWVPAHFPDDPHGLARFDGTPLFEHADPRQGRHPDWGSLIFNYGRHEVRSFLLSSACFWLERYHADGLRIDAVASMLYLDYSRPAGEWIPNRFGGRENLGAIELLRHLNRAVHDRVPGALTFAEESTGWPGVTSRPEEGGLGFDFKWDMGWMHDTLQHFSRDPIHRRHHLDELTFRALYRGSEEYLLPLSHDEVVHGKGSLLSKLPGDDWQRFATLRTLLGYQYATPGKQLLFMGTELAPPTEWSHDGELDWRLETEPERAGLAQWLADLNGLHREEPALHHDSGGEGEFEWVDVNTSDSVVTFLRHGAGRPVLAVVNLTPVVRSGYRVGIPQGGRWSELLNSDATHYGGSGVGNLGGVSAEEPGAHGRPFALPLTVAPLSILFLAPEGDAA